MRLSPSVQGVHDRRGFTLVEVLASLVLVAIILPPVMKGMSLALTAAALARQRVEAASLAESKLAELVATGAWQEGDSSGDFGSDWPDYRWSATVEDWEGTIVRQVDLSVLWKARGTERHVTLTTLVYTGSQ